MYSQTQSQDPNTWWDNSATGVAPTSSWECQQVPARISQAEPTSHGGTDWGIAAHPQPLTPAAWKYNPLCSPSPFPFWISSPHSEQRVPSTSQATQKQPVQEKQCWKFQHRILSARESLVYKNAFPLPHVFCLKANKCRQMSFQLQLCSGHQSTQISPSDVVPDQPKPSLEI